MVMRMDDIQSDPSIITHRVSDRPLTLLPDPGPREVWCPVISVDDHALEPKSLFDRVPAQYRDLAPKMLEREGAGAIWQIEDKQRSVSGTDGAVGRPWAEVTARPSRLEEFRRGVWDVDARVRDMDLNGVWASLNFPSSVWGFAGTALSTIPDPAAAFACVQAYNDWVVEEWCGRYQDRFIPCQLPFLADPTLAAQEVRRNAARGVPAVSFSENPHLLDYPSLYGDHWDPFFEACEETETVINLHVGSSGTVNRPSPQSPPPVMIALFTLNGMSALVDWIYAKIPVRFPNIKVVMSEAGVSWVPTIVERLQRAYRQREGFQGWSDSDPHPVDVLHRNFWFTSIEDPSAFRMLDIINPERVMLEVDYPHPDSSWPDSQALFRSQMEFLPEDVIRKICFENAADLYRHPRPPASILAQSVVGGEA